MCLCRPYLQRCKCDQVVHDTDLFQIRIITVVISITRILIFKKELIITIFKNFPQKFLLEVKFLNLRAFRHLNK